jgi:predicted membrane metal-binding protein
MYIYIPWAVIHLRKKKERKQREVKSLLWYHFLFWFSFLQNLFYVFWQMFIIFLTDVQKKKKIFYWSKKYNNILLIKNMKKIFVIYLL